MKKYILTSNLLQGAITFGYDHNGFIVFFNNEAGMDAKQSQWLVNNFPYQESDLHGLKTKIKGDLKEVPPDLSFDTFWDKYDKKINRKRCVALWTKMNDAHRMQAIVNIAQYDAFLKRTGYRGKADPENYLSKEHYTVDWSKER